MTRTVRLMKSQQPNGTLAATWIMGAGLIGMLGNVTSLGGVAIVIGLGLVPPMLLMLRWNRPVHAPQVNPGDRGDRVSQSPSLRVRSAAQRRPDDAA